MAHGIVVKNLCKYFPEKHGSWIKAVDNVTFNASFGEVFGLIGANGAGKTTTMRLLATLLRPTSGEAEVNGISITANPSLVRRNVGFLSTTTALYGRLTPREVAFYFGRLYGLDDHTIARRLEELTEILNLRSFLDRRCDLLSSGTRQKVSVLRTLLHNPPVIILDEPTAGLDVLASRAVIWLVEEARRQGKCVILSTHNMAEAEKLCDRIGIIHRGKLLDCRTKAEILAENGNLERAFLRLVGENS